MEKYLAWSGQKVNNLKSGLMFSNNCSEVVKLELGKMHGMKECARDIFHLENPLFIGKKRGDIFAFLKKKVMDRLEGWMEKTISKAGRTTLVKSVIQSIPVYSMSTYKLPVSFYRGLDKMARRFWWKGSGAGNRFMALLRWDELCKPKKLGDLGFCKFEDMNSALIAKLGWHLAAKSNLDWVDILLKNMGMVKSS